MYEEWHMYFFSKTYITSGKTSMGGENPKITLRHVQNVEYTIVTHVRESSDRQETRVLF